MIHDLQRIQIKIAADALSDVSLDAFLKIFGRWRTEKEHPAEWVDLADYAHMAAGPGIVLIGRRSSISFDLTPPGPGILYVARKGLTGSHAERIASAFAAGLKLTERLIGEKEFPGNIRLRPDAIEVRFLDRLQTPNNQETDSELRPALRQVLDALLGPNAYQLSPQIGSGQACGFSITLKNSEPLDVLLGRLAHAVRP